MTEVRAASIGSRPGPLPEVIVTARAIGLGSLATFEEEAGHG